MTKSQKIIKVISLILIVFSILAIIAGLVTLLGGVAVIGEGASASAASQTLYATSAGLLFVLGIGSLISGIIDLIIGILGLRGAKDPSKIGPFFVISIIGLILSAISFIGTVMSGGDVSAIVSGLVSLALLIGCVYFANDIRKLA